MPRLAAHDIAHQLTIINFHCELGRREATRGELSKAVRRFVMIEEAASDSGKILRQTFFNDIAAIDGECELNALARKLNRQIEDDLRTKNIELRLSLWPTPIKVEGDSMDMQRAIYNLGLNARNAIGRNGVIMITTRCEADAAILQVKDTGRGMSAEELDVLWTRAPRGSHGYGLFLVRRTVNELAGKISVESKPGEGSTFTITIPRSNCSDAQSGMAAA